MSLFILAGTVAALAPLALRLFPVPLLRSRPKRVVFVDNFEFRRVASIDTRGVPGFF